jgi:adenylylsulfate kinase
MSFDNVVWYSPKITQKDRLKRLNQRPCIIWFTGLSASGKSTIANAVEQHLFQRGHMTYLLDGDNLRHGLSQDLGFSEEDRIENIRRVGEVSKLFLDAGIIVLSAFISPFKADRQIARNLVNNGDFIEVFVDTPLKVCEQRDPKGLYEKARSGNITNFTGIDSPYEIPDNPEVRVCGYDQSIIDSSLTVIKFLENNNYI